MFYYIWRYRNVGPRSRRLLLAPGAVRKRMSGRAMGVGGAEMRRSMWSLSSEIGSRSREPGELPEAQIVNRGAVLRRKMNTLHQPCAGPKLAFVRNPEPICLSRQSASQPASQRASQTDSQSSIQPDRQPVIHSASQPASLPASQQARQHFRACGQPKV